MLFISAGNSFAQNDLVSSVMELQAIARKTNGGGLGNSSDFGNVFPGKVSV